MLRKTNAVASAALLVTSAAPISAQQQSLALEEIIVTAQKRAQSVQDVPLAVTALSAARHCAVPARQHKSPGRPLCNNPT